MAKLGKMNARALALRVLEGVGDASAGQWEEWTGETGAYHIKRRLTAEEEKLTGPAVDIRGDAEEVARRTAPVAHLLPQGFTE